MTWDRFVVKDKHIVHLNFFLSKRDISSLLQLKEGSIPKHFVISYCLFTNALFNFELVFVYHFFCYPNTAYSGFVNSFTHRKGQSLNWTETLNFILLNWEKQIVQSKSTAKQRAFI